MYRSWRRNVLGNQLARHSAQTDLFGASDKLSVGYFGTHPRLSQIKPRFHRSRPIAAQCAPTFASSRTARSSSFRARLWHQLAFPSWITLPPLRCGCPVLGMSLLVTVEADENPLRLTQAASLERSRCADNHGLASAPLGAIRACSRYMHC
jgi:hypothetical protein